MGGLTTREKRVAKKMGRSPKNLVHKEGPFVKGISKWERRRSIHLFLFFVVQEGWSLASTSARDQEVSPFRGHRPHERISFLLYFLFLLCVSIQFLCTALKRKGPLKPLDSTTTVSQTTLKARSSKARRATVTGRSEWQEIKEGAH